MSVRGLREKCTYEGKCNFRRIPMSKLQVKENICELSHLSPTTWIYRLSEKLKRDKTHPPIRRERSKIKRIKGIKTFVHMQAVRRTAGERKK